MFSTKVRSLVLVVLVVYFQSSGADDSDDSDCPAAGTKIGVLTGKDKTEMLEEHNKIRTALGAANMKCHILQPQAKSLPILRWDDKLAKKACEVSSTCKMAHIKVTGELQDTYGCVGQNLYIKLGTSDESLDSAKAVGAWRDECNKYNIHKPNSTLFVTGHWTQLIWNTTTAVGCCKSTWPADSDSFNHLVTCNYGPCGNTFGVLPYLPGKP